MSARKLCRRLLRLLPSEFHARYAAELEEDYVALLQERNAAGKLIVWARLLADVARFRLERRWRPPAATRGRWDQLRQDVVTGARVLRRSRSTMLIVLTLALGLGATSAMFSVLDAVVLDELPYRDPDRLVSVWRAPKTSFPPADYVDIEEMNRVFSSIVAYSSDIFDVVHEGREPFRLFGAITTREFFDVMGTAPLVGRLYVSEPDEAAIVLRHDTWQRHFGGDPDIVGVGLRLNDDDYVVSGVMPPGFDALGVGLWVMADGRVPYPPVDVEGDIAANRRLSYLRIVGRLAEGVSLSEATADLDRIGTHLRDAHPSRGDEFGVVTEPLYETVIGGARKPLWLLFGSAVVLLLITCINVAGILLGQGVARRRELSVRAALGAGRLRLGTELLIESALIGLMGLAAGLVFGYGILHVVRTAFGTAAPRLSGATLDGRVVAFGLLVTFVATFVFGALPALAATRFDVALALRAGGERTGTSRSATLRRRLLVAVEVGLAGILLSGALHLGSSWHRLMTVDTGFDRTDLTTIGLAIPRSRYPDEASQARFYRGVLDALTRDPATREAALGFLAPFNGPGASAGYKVERREADTAGRPTADLVFASPRYRETLGVPLRRGRDFTTRDVAGSEPVVLVSASLAAKEWPGTEAVGQRLKVGRREEWFRVVGVIGDARIESPRIPPRPTLYVPLEQAPMPFMSLLVRASDPGPPVRTIRSVVKELDPLLPLGQVRSLDDALAGATSSPRLRTVVIAIFSFLALVLAASGLYAVVSNAAAERERELGIRTALGASPRSIARLLASESALVGLTGASVTLVASLAAGRFVESLLFGIHANDAAILGGTVVLLLVVTVAASYAPIRRALANDTLDSLRAD